MRVKKFQWSKIVEGSLENVYSIKSVSVYCEHIKWGSKEMDEVWGINGIKIWIECSSLWNRQSTNNWVLTSARFDKMRTGLQFSGSDQLKWHSCHGCIQPDGVWPSRFTIDNAVQWRIHLWTFIVYIEGRSLEWSVNIKLSWSASTVHLLALISDYMEPRVCL